MNSFSYRLLAGCLFGTLFAVTAHAAGTPPRAIERTAPQYAWDLRRERAEGTVTVSYTVRADGTVTRPKIIGASNRVFEKPVLDAVESWKFEPATRDGRAVECLVEQEIRFTLAPEQPTLVASK
ncbi:energy transducer TonB [Nibricoccus sp. IMCC34717]|uniref:energy transducer TonB n=1 Tax=Nibricoccus sp. IMCC34717 TaxID=3034021 RepID=UPI00384A5909